MCQSTTEGGTCPGDSDCFSPCFKSTKFSNIEFDKIKGVIDLDSIGRISSNTSPGQYFLHVDSTDASLDLVNKLSGSFLIPSQINVNSTSNFTKGLPPSSLHSFLEKRRSMPGVVVTDYDDKFSNLLYNSELDLATEWTQTNIDSTCAFTTYFAQKIYSLAGETDSIPPDINANCTLVSICEIMQ